MILEQQKEATVLSEGEAGESIKMSLDLDSAQILMQMLSKNLYSDEIGSTVRETASNALDSHRRSGVTDPIIVSFKTTKDGNYEFAVEDFGTGLDADDVQNIISKYGKSTKRNSKNELGMMGLGFKAPLAYSSSFYFVCRKAGMERKYMMYEGEDGNTIDLLYEKATTEKNGVKVIVPVKWQDRGQFENRIKEQLCYFEGVFFDCPNTSIDNNFIIVRTEHFQWSEMATDSKMHICLDNVYYPIDFPKLGIQPLNFPIALRFSLSDGLFPVPNREQLKYTTESKAVILNKLEKVADFFVNKYNATVKDGDNIFDIFNYYTYNTRYVHGISKDRSLDANILKQYSKVQFVEPQLKQLKLLKVRDLLMVKDYLVQEFVVKYNLRNGRFNSEERSRYRSTLYFNNLTEKDTIYKFTEMDHQKKTYLRETIGQSGSSKQFVRREKFIKLGNPYKKIDGSNYNNWIKILQLQLHPRSEWRARIKEAQTVIDLVTANMVDVDKIVVPQKWVEDRKKEKVKIMTAKGTNVRRKKLTGEVTGKMSEQLERYVSGKNCKFVSTVIQMKDAHKSKNFIVYSNQDYENKMQEYYNVFPKNVKFVMFSERELKNLKDIELHNWMTMEEFEKGKHKVFRRAVTAYLIDQLISKYSSVFNKRQILQKVSTDLFTKLEELKEYQEKYHIGRGNEEIYKAMLSVAEEGNLYDPKPYALYKELKAVLEKLTFLNPLLAMMYVGYAENTQHIDIIKDLFKYYKHKMDWENYVPEVIEEPALTEEEVEELESEI